MQALKTLRLTGNYPEVIKVGELMKGITPNNPEIYEELCIAYYHTGEKRLSYNCLENIFNIRPVNSNILERAISNKLLYEDLYVKENWSPTFKPTIAPIKVVTLTITSCKRLQLFIKTVDSFLTNCVDLDLIKEYICVDDNSSEDDRKVMQEKYPFFKFIFKQEKDKGHPKSMNIIIENITTPYNLHLEDDWLFINRISISDLLEIMNHDISIKQVCLNKNYSELPEKRIAGGIEKYTSGNLRYFIHEYITTKNNLELFYKKHGYVYSSFYWPNYTLQPSLVDTSIFKTLKFEAVVNFERYFAEQYTKLGWKTAFHQEVNCRHIGKLLTEQGENSYALNNEKQF